MSMMLAAGQVDVIESRAAFDRLGDEWNALVSRTTDQAFYRHEFLSNWLDHFARGSLYVVILRDDHGGLTAALPLMRSWSHLRGVPVRQLRSTANIHSGRYDMIADNPALAAPVLFRHLAQNCAWDMLLLTDVPRQGAAGWLYAAASAMGYPTGKWTGTESPYLCLPATWDDLSATLSRRFKANLRRRSRGLEKRGRLTFRRTVNCPDLVAVGMHLELNGWKGRAGTAMVQNKATMNFYLRLAHHLARNNCLTIWTMYLDDHLLAFQYGVEHRGCYALLKPAYNEQFGSYSPGQLLMAEVLRNAIAQGLTRFDFLGENMPWKQDWRPQLQTHEWLFVFRNSYYGRLLHAAKFQIPQRIRHPRKRPLS